MSRHRSTTTLGTPFDAATIEAVWEKAQTSARHRPLKLDTLGSLIWRPAYGNTNSKFGWEIDHIKPVGQGGGDELENLQPLQWENNLRKGETFVNSRPNTQLTEPEDPGRGSAPQEDPQGRTSVLEYGSLDNPTVNQAL